MDIIYRPFDPNTDMSGLHKMYNHIYPERSLTLEELLEAERVTSPEVIRQRMIAIHDGRTVGFAMASHTPGDPVGDFFIVCWVHCDVRRQGIGQKMTQEVISFAVARQAQKLITWVREDAAFALRFAETHGFAKVAIGAENVLELESFDITKFDDPMMKLITQGFSFSDFSRWGDTLEHRQALHNLFLTLFRDAPNNDYQPSFEDFQKQTLGHKFFEPSGVQLALDAKGQTIGFSSLNLNPSTGESFCDGTWVHADYRGQGVAFALKLVACRWALTKGVKKIVTGNDSSNAPMLAINTKLGFRTQIGLWQMQRVIDAGSRDLL
jgi:GNAT superfamily N-acetyltransferase